MTRIHLAVEGQTEEVVAREVLVPYLENDHRVVTYSILATKRTARGTFRGGVSSWPALRPELARILRDPTVDVLTTMIDYFRFPTGSPGMADRPAGDGEVRASHVEHALAADIADPRFRPHLMLHEFEAWVLAGHDAMADLLGQGPARKLRAATDAAGGPERVNDGHTTSPAARIEEVVPGYRKTVDGPLIVLYTGIDVIRSRCPHADAWLTTLESS